MRYEPLALTREQTEAVLAAANAVPPPWRFRFLALVADKLLGQPLTTANIIAAADSARVALIAGVGDE